MKKVFLLLSMMILLTACGNDGDKGEESSEANTQSDVYANFQNIDIEILEKQAIVTGEVDVSDNIFYYQVEQEEKVLIEEQQVKVEEEWDEFKLAVDLTDEMKVSEEVLIVKMYTKGKDGSIVNPNYIPIEVNKTEES